MSGLAPAWKLAKAGHSPMPVYSPSDNLDDLGDNLDDLGESEHYLQDNRVAEDINAMDPSELEDDELTLEDGHLDDEVTIQSL